MLSIGNDHIGLTLAPDFGARVVDLTDRSSGRQWLVTGPDSTATGDDAQYGADEAVGWDECFPTVLPCHHPAWGPLRDHGALWGRAWHVDRLDATCVETRLDTARFRFARRLTLQGATVTADYSVSNPGPAPVPYLWSQHCLLATTPGDRIALTGVQEMRSLQHPLHWPHHPDRDLSRVADITAGFALKAYGETPGPASAAVIGADGGLRLDWDDAPAFGLWLCYGGWPAGRPVHQVALEPTTAPADSLAEADAMGKARILPPNHTHRWAVRMTVTAPTERTLQ